MQLQLQRTAPLGDELTLSGISLLIREATNTDFDAIWDIFKPIVRLGTTYAFDVTTSKDEAMQLWMDSARKTYVVEIDGQILGTYHIKTNKLGPGSHVCNCGYMVGAQARGKGLATAMCQHSLKEAVALGYRAMQFNFVASTNDGAVRLWQSLGFEIVGTLPGAFNHPQVGFVDAYVMFQSLV